MSVEQSSKAWQLNIQGSLKLVLLSLADHADSHGRHVFPSQEFTSQRCGISVRQVRRLLHQLEEMGLIIPVAYPKGGRKHATEYELKLDQPETNPEPKPSGISADPYFIPEEFINSPSMRNLQPKDYQTLAHDVLRTKPSAEPSFKKEWPWKEWPWTWGVGGAVPTNIRQILPEENPDNLSAFTEPDIESKTRTDETQKADICDIKADICDIKPDIAMSDQPSITVIEPSIEPLDGAKAPKPPPIYPEWFIPLTGLPGFVNREYPQFIPKVEAQCKASGVSVATVVAAFAEYYADSYITHNWKNPVSALKGTLHIQINKVKGTQQQKTTTPRQVAPAEDIDTVWANTAAFFERD